MKPISATQRLWLYRAITLLVITVVVHLLTVWFAPRLIMQVLMHGPAAQAMDMHNKAAFPPAVTAASRLVVMPSPDLLYSVCVFDVSGGPIRITANPGLPSYWSVALYAANSDNFFVVNDRQAAGKSVDLWLVSGDANTSAPPAPIGSQVVVTPSTQGFLLMRVLTGDYEAEQAVVEPARRTLRCTKV
jgi:uncharacterized membrane protein